MAAISSVPDPVFSTEMVGPGVALVPESILERQTVCAPVSGVIGALFPHAFAIEADLGVGVLVHLGIDTVGLEGEGFEVLVSSGDYVEVGQPLIIWSPVFVAGQGKSIMCPVILVQQAAESLLLSVLPDQAVAVGQPLLTWNSH